MPIETDFNDRINRTRTDPGSDFSTSSIQPSKYAINTFNYPSDLGSDALQHYVNFQINVRGKSEFNRSNRLFETSRNPDSANLTSEQVGDVAVRGAGLAAGIVAGGIAKSFYKKITKSGGLASNLVGATAGVGVGLAAGAAISANNLLKPDTSYRISDSINLAMDSPPTVRYSMNYANKDLGTLAGLISGSAFDTQSMGSGSAESLAAIGTAFAKLPGAFGTVDVQSAISASSKTSLNPFREVIFESVDFRTFTFKYKFLPKSKEEVNAVNNIVKLFKFHMHPEMSQGKLFFIYPSEFVITYFYKMAENIYFHKFSPCALESMDVTYGGETFSSFADGAPVEVNISLSFKELEILTKKMIEKGY